MSYVDAFHDTTKDKIFVVERVDGKRTIQELQPEYNFFYSDPKGKQRNIYGDPVSEIRCRSLKDFRKNVAMNKGKGLCESDVRPINKTIAKHYNGAEPPKLHTCFFDIEVDFDPERGYSSPDDPFTPITAIGVYLDWLEAMVCLAVPPKRITWEQAEEMTKHMPEVKLCRTEAEMLELFLGLIDDADILSGWNSEGYDIPYTHNRIVRVLGKKETAKLCLMDKYPKKRVYERMGSERTSYDLIGRVHLDYLELYRKYNYEERHSYRLDYIGEMELGEKKVAYEGSLDRLYNYDFEKFCEYNIQDVMLLAKMDTKLQFIDLANTIAHDNTVLLPVTMGAVATTEQAIINEAHRRDMVVPDRTKTRDSDNAWGHTAAGAYVAFPKKGLHEWVGSMDLLDKKSFADAWLGKFGSNEYDMVMSKDIDHVMQLDMADGTSVDVTGADVYNLIFNSGQPWNISANGTIFKTDFQGIVPGLLERWYSERQVMQGKKKKAKDDAEQSYWDKRQLVKKINLNSLYGAILNPGCRFFDHRIGQSTTLTGRAITKHMGAQTNKLFTGKYDHTGDTIVYGDTDSVYFSATPALPEGEVLDMDSAIKLYDHVSDQVSATFPQFLKDNFNVPKSSGEVMKAGREVVGRAGLFITKKRYAIQCLDIEGYQPEGGKLKAMGLDLKRSDTPEFIQDFLEEILIDCLNGVGEDEVIEKIREYKKYFRTLEPWKKGMPKRANNMTMYSARVMQQAKVPENYRLHKLDAIKKESQSTMVPGHVRASINWNNLKQANSDNYSITITDGAKVIVCRMKSNPMGYTSVAYPTDELNIPKWFKELPFDEDAMEEAVLDKKVSNVIGAMGFDLSRMHDSETLQAFFEF